MLHVLLVFTAVGQNKMSAARSAARDEILTYVWGVEQQAYQLRHRSLVQDFVSNENLFTQGPRQAVREWVGHSPVTRKYNLQDNTPW